MFEHILGRGRIAGLTRAALVIGAAALSVTLAGCGAGSAAGSAPATSRAATPSATAPGTAQQVAARPAASQPTASQPTASPGAVPWPSVGPGWVLDTYSTGTYAKPAPVTLYLASPAGAKYPLLTWPTSATAPALVAWAGDKTQALLAFYQANAQPARYDELNLMTGTMTRVAFPEPGTQPLGYTLPDGQQILGVTPDGSDNTIARYTQAGALVQTLASGNDDPYSAVYSPDGTALAVPAAGGLQLISNAGGVLRHLPMPGAPAKTTCDPVRWWNATTILAGCQGLGLWLVPSGGAAPTRLTPPRVASFDDGDIDAWQLPSGLYLQSLGACGALELNKQASDGSVSAVNVPGLIHTPVVVTAAGARLLVEAHDCHGGDQLVWYDPGTGAEQWIFRAGGGQTAIPYNDPEDGTIR
jgi:hypothetical protein